MTSFIKYTLTSLEPIRISDDRTSQMGQTDTKRYIPGSTIRGLVVSKMANRDDFENYRRFLLSDNIRFMNAYPSVSKDNQEFNLIPSIKGFYEDKTERKKKDILNSLIKTFPGNYKRASMGLFSEIEEDTLYFYSPETTSDLKITIGKRRGEEKNVFRSEYLTANQKFTGYIAIDSEDLQSEIVEIIEKILNDNVIIGSARSAGLGKCRVETSVFKEGYPYEGISVNSDIVDECFLYLVSDTVMRNEIGEYCGIDLNQLEEDLGVEELQIRNCATSVISVRGYNRHYGGPVPSVTMYEKGSVFHLSFKGSILATKVVAIAETGIGERRNEGFGQVRILKDFEKIKFKEKLPTDVSCHYEQTEHKEDYEVLKMVASIYFRQRIREAAALFISGYDTQKINSLSNSQVGNVLALAVANRFTPENGIKDITTYLLHALEKDKKFRATKEEESIHKLVEVVNEVLNLSIHEETNPSEARKTTLQNLLFTKEYRESIRGMVEPDTIIMGFPAKDLISDEEENGIRLEILANLIRYCLKEDK